MTSSASVGSKGAHAAELSELLDGPVGSGQARSIERYLVRHSNLPGPRGNLELAKTFAELVEKRGQASASRFLWGLCMDLMSGEGGSNTPGEFVVFCGVRGMAALGATSVTYRRRTFARLREFAKDQRWRVREAVAVGLQDLLMDDPGETLDELQGWVESGNWLEMRAVAAGVAEPSPLENPAVAKMALELHKRILSLVIQSGERKTEQFLSLRQTLGYSLSVVAVAMPKEAFGYLELLTKTNDPDILWIVRENLRKNRLSKFQANIADVMRLLEETRSA